MHKSQHNRTDFQGHLMNTLLEIHQTVANNYGSKTMTNWITHVQQGRRNAGRRLRGRARRSSDNRLIDVMLGWKSGGWLREGWEKTCAWIAQQVVTPWRDA